MKIGIAGAGGIGSNVAANLVRSGVLDLKIIDFDRVESSNLNRQFYFSDQIGRLKVEALGENLRRINSNLRLETGSSRITADNCQPLFADCDFLVEGLDHNTEKKMLLEQWADRVPMVSACGIAGTELESITSRQLGSCYIVGDFRTDCADARLYAYKVLTIANHMTRFILQQQGVLHDNQPQ